MRLLKRGAAVIGLAALLLPAAARADELLVMPYTCSTAGGQPVLTPAADQGYRIIGPRDQRKFQACSPVNPGMCRSWTVYRFDLDCDGTRVSWVSVVAATNEGSRRAWLLDGRLLLRMGAKWSLAPDDPCAQGSGPDERPVFGGPLRRQCTERLAMAPPPVVEMPFGYAPMLGIDGIFVPQPPGAKTLPPIVAGEAQTKSASADAKPPSSPWAGTLGEPPVTSDPKDKQAQLPPPPSLVPPPAPQPAPKVASTPQVAPPAVDDPALKSDAEPKPGISPGVPKVAPTAPPLPAKEAAPPGSQGPRIVSLPPPPPAPEMQKKAAPSEPKPAVGGGSPAPKIAVATPSREAERRVSEPETELGPDSVSGPGLLSLFRTTTIGVIVAVAGLALGLIAAFALARRRERARDAGRRRRDISALSLDGRHAKASVRSAAGTRPDRGAPAYVPPGPPPNPQSRLPSAPPPAVAPPPPVAPPLMEPAAMPDWVDWDDRMPRTREEALEVLGIGIAPSATATAIKKIVDGLRMSWHPDLAQNETDRALREHRSKQINAAWDILQGQRAEA
jgi:hypothetical protein